MANFQDVKQAIQAWSLDGVVEAKDVKGRSKVKLTLEGDEQVYPYWLAVMKVNQFGASYSL